MREARLLNATEPRLEAADVRRDAADSLRDPAAEPLADPLREAVDVRRDPALEDRRLGTSSARGEKSPAASMAVMVLTFAEDFLRGGICGFKMCDHNQRMHASMCHLTVYVHLICVGAT